MLSSSSASTTGKPWVFFDLPLGKRAKNFFTSLRFFTRATACSALIFLFILTAGFADFVALLLLSDFDLESGAARHTVDCWTKYADAKARATAKFRILLCTLKSPLDASIHFCI